MARAHSKDVMRSCVRILVVGHALSLPNLPCWPWSLSLRKARKELKKVNETCFWHIIKWLLCSKAAIDFICLLSLWFFSNSDSWSSFFAQRSTCCRVPLLLKSFTHSVAQESALRKTRRSGSCFVPRQRKPRQADAAALAGQARTTAIVRIQKLLSSMDFRSRFEGTLLTKTVGLSLAEAKQKGIAQIIHALRHDTSSAVPLQLAAGQVLAGWKWRRVSASYKKLAEWSAVVVSQKKDTHAIHSDWRWLIESLSCEYTFSVRKSMSSRS